MFEEGKRGFSRNTDAAVCSICTANNAKDASAFTIQSSSVTAVLQRALFQHVASNPSSVADILPSLNEHFSNANGSESNMSNSVPANKEVLSLIWQILGKGWHDVPTEYNALPCEITIADTDCSNLNEENISGNIIKYICDVCKNLLKSYCTFERFCERIVFKILRLSFKPMLLIETSQFSQSKAEQKETGTKNSISKNLNLDVKFNSNCVVEKLLPEKSQRKKRGRPRKKVAAPCKAQDKPSITDLSKSICPFCHKQYSIRHSFVHSCLPYRNSLRCPECNVFSSSYVRFEKHLETYHQEKKRFLCDVDNCKQRFISESAFTWHNHFHTLDERSNLNFNAHAVNSNDLTSTDSISEAVTVNNTCQRYNSTEDELGGVDKHNHNSESQTQSFKPINIDTGGDEVQDEGLPSQPAEQQFPKTKDSSSSVYLVLSETDSCITEPQFLMSDEGLMLSSADQWSDVQHGEESYVGTDHSDRKVMNLSFSVAHPAAVQSSGRLQFCSDLRHPGYTEEHPNLFRNISVNDHQQNTQTSNRSLDSDNRNMLCEDLPRNVSETNVLSRDESATLVSLGVGDVNFQESSNCQETLVEHISSQHQISEQEFECPVCDKPFKSIPVLMDHLNTHSNIGSCKCLICSVNVKNIITKSTPPLSFEATDPINHRCSLCSIKFETCNLLLQHNLCVHQQVPTHESILGCSSKSDLRPKSNEAFPLPGDARSPQLPCDTYAVPVGSSQFRSNDISGHSLTKNNSVAGSFLQNTVGLPVEGVFVPTVTCVTPGDDAFHYSEVTAASRGNKSMEQVSASEDTLSIVPGYRTSNPVLSYHQNASGLSYSSDQTALNISGRPAGAECSEEDLGRQRLSCDSCGMLFLGHSALASHVHSCQTFGSKLDTPFPDDNFLPATENLSVVNALEGSSGSALTPIERLIGSVDDMDYFG